MVDSSTEVPLGTYDYIANELLAAAFDVMSGDEQDEDVDGAEVAAFVMACVCAAYHYSEGSKTFFTGKIEASIYQICMNEYVAEITPELFFEIRHERRRWYGAIIKRWLGGEFTREQAAVYLATGLIDNTTGTEHHPLFENLVIETRNAIAITSDMAPRTVVSGSSHKF